MDYDLWPCVSTLVLMDSWIKTFGLKCTSLTQLRFNPCFNGFMDKDGYVRDTIMKRESFQPLF